MLTALRLGNFKAFAETQTIPIRPLTLIFGANSSGKSSLIHGLLFARHALETGELDTFRTVVGGESVDLGGFKQYIHRREAERRVEWGATLQVAEMPKQYRESFSPARTLEINLTIGYISDLTSDSGQLMLFPDMPTPKLKQGLIALISYEIRADDALLLRMFRRSDGTLRIDRLESQHPVFREFIGGILELRTTTSLTPNDYETVDAAITALLSEIHIRVERMLPSQILLPTTDRRPNESLPMPISKGSRNGELGLAVKVYLPRELDRMLRGLNETLTANLSRLRYLGPLRSYPPRSFALAQHYDPNWYAGGGYAWDVVQRNTTVREAVNAWLGADRLKTRYQLIVRDMVSVDQLDDAIYSGLENVNSGLATDYEERKEFDEHIEQGPPQIHELEEATEIVSQAIRYADIDRVQQLIMVDRRTATIVSHRDIGIGISQVLPVLVTAYGSENSLLAIEQPEIHLHPALQADLGDVFIESALGTRRNTFVLETHSEHLILRIMRRMRDTVRGTLPEGMPAVRPEDVAILYVQPRDDSSASVVFELTLDEDGELRDEWPGGFFEEGFHERFA